jgi:hypothetical protein
MKRLALFVAAATFASSAVQAIPVHWADLTGATTNQVTGTITAGSDVVGVTFSGSYGFAQTSGAGINYWIEPNPALRPYTGGIVDNAPPDTDIIALSEGGPKTITFSEPVTDPFLALVSWNGNAPTFGQPFEIISQGCGFWGCGTFSAVTPTSFIGSGELHGIIRFPGTHTSLTFTDTSEFWHGIQIGIAAVGTQPPPTGVPEPTTLALLAFGLLALVSVGRRRKLSRGE